MSLKLSYMLPSFQCSLLKGNYLYALRAPKKVIHILTFTTVVCADRPRQLQLHADLFMAVMYPSLPL